jgi:hypothetical protein
MKRILWRRRLSWLAAVAVAAAVVTVLARAVADSKRPAAQTARPKVPSNSGWTDLFEKVNKGQMVTIDASKLPDVGKGVIESPTKQLLTANTVPAAAPAAPAFVNPKVEPGKVCWHKTFADACAAAKKSGKPVLLFQMMGKLDERFC